MFTLLNGYWRASRIGDALHMGRELLGFSPNLTDNSTLESPRFR